VVLLLFFAAFVGDLVGEGPGVGGTGFGVTGVGAGGFGGAGVGTGPGGAGVGNGPGGEGVGAGVGVHGEPLPPLQSAADPVASSTHLVSVHV
jgi:hypothetical protein